MDATIQPFLGSTPYTLSAQSTLRHQQVPSCTAYVQTWQPSAGSQVITDLRNMILKLR